MITLELTKEEAVLVADFLQNAPLKGTLLTLPATMTMAANVVQKIGIALNAPEPTKLSAPVELKE